MSQRIDGKVAFITGAARGQGRSHAVRLAESGADIIAIDACTDIATVPYRGASPSDLQETVELVEATGRRIVTRVCDVRDYHALEEALRDGVAELGRLDIVCANAGILSMGFLADLSLEAWRDMIDINLTGVWHTCRAAIPYMIAGREGGSIVITSSAAGLRGSPGVGHYGAAKHAVIGLTRTLALELASHSIRVNAIAPTTVDTPMIQNEALMRQFLPHAEVPSYEEFAAVSQSRHKLPVPWIEVADVSEAVLFLVSEAARYINGITLPVDTGSAA
jgi:SDR family mycofactocin-dependent oxidoreductase